MSSHLLPFMSVILTLCTCSSFDIYVNISNISSQKVWNPYYALNRADYTQQWLNEETMNNTNPTIKERYGFLNTQKLAYTSGGCYKGYESCTTTFDLLQNPSDTNSKYNFTQLDIAIANILNQGLKPYLVLGLIPISYSINATLSSALNLRVFTSSTVSTKSISPAGN